MNKNIDLTKILEDCPKGFELYSSIYGTVTFEGIDYNDSKYPICVKTSTLTATFSKEGLYFCNCSDSECCLFPSREQRDWSKFTAPRYKKEKFDPMTLKPFDKVLIKSDDDTTWVATLFSHIIKFHDAIIPEIDYLESATSYCTSSFCIPYNDDTKHLIGTKDEAPEYYRYWED